VLIQDHLTVENEIVAALRRIIRAVDLHSRQLLDQYGLTGPQLVILQHVERLDGAPASTLARVAHLSRPTVTGILDRLNSRGLVQRAPDPKDRRSYQVSITASGRQVLANAPSLLQDKFRRELASLEDWEQSMILSTLQRIAIMMDAEAIPAAPVLVTGPVSSVDGSPADAVVQLGENEKEPHPRHSPTEPSNGR
jgi:DNA-binding MarR family transcriptional regulator